MKKIALFVVLAYLAISVVLTWPVLALCFAYDGCDPTDFLGAFVVPQYWIFIGILLVCEAGLLFLPMRIERKRPVARRHVLLPIIVAGFLTGALLFGVILSLDEFIQQDRTLDDEWVSWTALASWILLWLVWSVVFYRMSRDKDPRHVILYQCRRLMQGSVIALLVAVPTHIVARCRDYCCAGFATFIGITFGIAVMLLSFGPGIFFLYAERWRKLHPAPRSGANVEDQENNESDS